MTSVHIYEIQVFHVFIIFPSVQLPARQSEQHSLRQHYNDPCALQKLNALV